MARVIPFEERRQKQKAEDLSKAKKQRSNSLRMVMQCSACPHKCAKCGSHLDVPQSQIISERLPLKLCRGCWEEYRLYLDLASGRSPVQGQEYYHTQTWREVWRSWLEYQKTLQEYRNSEEFSRLVEELTDV